MSVWDHFFRVFRSGESWEAFTHLCGLLQLTVFEDLFEKTDAVFSHNFTVEEEMIGEIAAKTSIK